MVRDVSNDNSIGSLTSLRVLDFFDERRPCKSQPALKAEMIAPVRLTTVAQVSSMGMVLVINEADGD